MEQVVIIGNGIAGITAARHIRKNSNAAITVISSETPHFFSRTALMYVYMGHMTFEHTKPYEDWFWEKNRIGLVQDHVKQIDTEKKQLFLDQSAPISFDKLIIAIMSLSKEIGADWSKNSCFFSVSICFTWSCTSPIRFFSQNQSS
jgi:NADH dehydrogenase FAD-containing subunit